MTRAEWEITHARAMPVPKQLSIHLGWTQPYIHSGEVRGLRHKVGASHISTATVPACKPYPNSLLRLHLHFISFLPEPMIYLTHCLLVQPSEVSGGGSLRVLLQPLRPFLCQLSSHLYLQSTVQQHLVAFWVSSEVRQPEVLCKMFPFLSFTVNWQSFIFSLPLFKGDGEGGVYLILHHHEVVNTGKDLLWSSRPTPLPPLLKAGSAKVVCSVSFSIPPQMVIPQHLWKTCANVWSPLQQ